jgi:hypothetical protein
MSRKAKGRPFSAALFPFLAVLMCTMGALIVLLVVFIQRTRFDASALVSAQAEAGKSEDEQRRIRERIDDAQWRQEMLEKSRAEKTDELAQARSRVAHLEEHAQRLEAKAKELLERAQAIDEGKKLRDEDMAATKAEAAKLKAEIEKKKEEIEKAKKNSPQGQEWYALIPYDGRSGTRRRPIYVECTEFGVIIQPEGLRLTTEDFNGPLGPGNPLDSALRAIRDYWERSAGTNAGQPYPLLVVRPSGVIAFRAARAGISAWDDEWGYELINDDKIIDFGPPDPALNATINKTVSVARQRQAAMIAMMPRRFQNEEPLKSFAPEPATATGNSRYVSGGVGNGPGGGSGLGGGSGANGNGVGNGVGANGGGVGNGSGIGGRFGGGNAGQAGGGIARGGYGNGPGSGGPGSGNGQTGNGGGNGAPGSGYGPAGPYAGGSGAMGYGAGGPGGAGGNGSAGGYGASGAGNGNGLGGTESGAGGAGNGGANNGGANNGLAGNGTGSGGSFGGGANGSGGSGIPSIAAAWNTNSASNDQRFGASNQSAPGMIGGGGGGGNGGDAFPGAQSGGNGAGGGGSGGGPGGNGAGGSSYGTAGGQGGTNQGGASQSGTGQYAASPGGSAGGQSAGGSAGGAAGGTAGGSGAGGGQFRSTMAPQSGGGGSSGAMGAGGGQSASSGTSMPFLLPTTPGSAAAHTDAATPGGGQPGFGQLPTNAGSQRGGDTGPTYGVDVAKRGKSGRGKNWALPQAKPTSIGVTRPIHISVEPNRVVMYPERGDSRAPKVVAIAPELSPDDVTHFVDAVQNEVKGWGLAVSEGYWKPVLQADIAPGAERQYMNLETALHGSGIEVTRR